MMRKRGRTPDSFWPARASEAAPAATRGSRLLKRESLLGLSPLDRQVRQQGLVGAPDALPRGAVDGEFTDVVVIPAGGEADQLA